MANQNAVSDIVRAANEFCLECESNVFSESGGFVVCVECGTAQERLLNDQAEWNCYSDSAGQRDTSAVRCGPAASLIVPDTQLNTYIAGSSKRLQRIHQWNNISSKDRWIQQIYKEFEQIGFTAGLPRPIVLASYELYKKLNTEIDEQNRGVKRSNVRQGLKAACIFFACKQIQEPRERKEIAALMNISSKTVTKGCNSFMDIMGKPYVEMELFKPVDFVARFSQLLGVAYPYQLKVNLIAEFAASIRELQDATPTSVACACIFFLSEHFSLNITKHDIHSKCGSSSVIIQKRYEKLLLYSIEIKALLQ